jgi:acetyltransferase-like isoleucine patch superfamily enzyme
VRAGEFLWMKSDIIIGGGGARGPRSYLTIGDRSTIIDRTFINVSEEVRIGSSTALSFNVVIITHGAWQPVLEGYRAAFGPVTIGDHAVVYLNSVIMPGVSVGDYATVAAGSVVLDDVPARCLAAGAPARIRRGPEGYPPHPDDAEVDALLGEVLRDYATTLPVKGARVAWASADGRVLSVELDGRRETVAYVPRTGPPPSELGPDGAPTLVLGHGEAGRVFPGAAYFDLASETVTGELSPLGEDLRDYLRRWTLRFFNGQPFRTLPQANVQRLKARAGGAR